MFFAFEALSPPTRIDPIFKPTKVERHWTAIRRPMKLPWKDYDPTLNALFRDFEPEYPPMAGKPRRTPTAAGSWSYFQALLGGRGLRRAGGQSAAMNSRTNTE